MQSENVDPDRVFSRDSPDASVCVVDGYGLHVAVDRGHLLVRDGIGPDRRERRYSRAGHGLRRIVVIGHAGSVTLEAHRWIADANIGYLHLTTSGRVLTTSGLRGRDDPALRRAQALAATNPIGVEITRYLLGRKLDGQAANALALDRPDITTRIVGHADDLRSVATMDDLRVLEAAAARHYWSAWASLELHYSRRLRDRVPEHWLTFGSRASKHPNVSGARRATNPPNAILNYLYALAEAEATLALQAIGLDAGLAWNHADAIARSSASLDILEAIRPDIDHYLLRILTGHVFTHEEIHELRDGTCRLLPDLTHTLATTLPTWAQTLGPVTEHVARLHAHGRPIPTLLTETNRRNTPERPPRTAALPPGCSRCGARLANRRRRLCDDCAAEAQTTGLKSAHRRLAELRKAGQDPSHRPDVRAAIGAANKRRAQERAAWNAAHPDGPPDPHLYEREILPSLRQHTAREVAAASGLSVQQAADLVAGRQTPHPMHWDKLRALASPRTND